MKEKRKIQRIDMRRPARIEGMAKDGKKIVVKAETKDISSHGAFFITEQAIDENVKLDIELFLSIEKLQELLGKQKKIKIQLQGTVIRSAPDGVAVSFGTKYQITALSNNH